MPPVLSKDSAKNRLSERKESIFSFPSMRFLSKSKTIQNKKPFLFFRSIFLGITKAEDPTAFRFLESIRLTVRLSAERMEYPIKITSPQPSCC